MEKVIKGFVPNGKVNAIPSKSYFQRYLLLSLLADGKTEIYASDTCYSDDVNAFSSCVKAYGAEVLCEKNKITVIPPEKIDDDKIKSVFVSDSGTCFRFFMCLNFVKKLNAELCLGEGIKSRNIPQIKDILRIKGNEYQINGDVSSQYISGLLIALSCENRDSVLKIKGKIYSKPYIDMTLSALRLFGAEIVEKRKKYLIHGIGKLKTPEKVAVPGDFSNAAVFLALGGLGFVTVSGLDTENKFVQGDKAILDILKKIGCDIKTEGENITVSKNKLKHFRADVSKTPDLFPIIAALATFCKGESVITGGKLLKHKESDRLLSIYDEITKNGGNISINYKKGKAKIKGGEHKNCAFDSHGDHRMVFAEAILASGTENTVISGCESVEKSYFGFFDDMKIISGEK